MVDAVLVTGGAGYVGSHACKALHRAGYLPVTYDNLERGNRWAVRWGPLEEGDLRDRSRLETVLDAHQPVAILHFAAYAYVAESIRRPRDYYANNVAGTLELLGAALSRDIRHVVFSSTCATYGIPATTPISEAHPQHPINPYGASKLMVERMLDDFDAAYGLRFVSLRYFNAAGADPDGEIGEVHRPETHLVPLAIAAACGEGEQLSILGTDYDTADGTAVRDYVHVDDLAEAHVRALRYLEQGRESVSINLGTGRGLSVREIVDAVEARSGRSITVHESARRPGDPPVLVADPSRARALLAWEAKGSSLEHIVDSAWNWHVARRAARACAAVERSPSAVHRHAETQADCESSTTPREARR